MTALECARDELAATLGMYATSSSPQWPRAVSGIKAVMADGSNVSDLSGLSTSSTHSLGALSHVSLREWIGCLVQSNARRSLSQRNTAPPCEDTQKSRLSDDNLRTRDGIPVGHPPGRFLISRTKKQHIQTRFVSCAAASPPAASPPPIIAPCCVFFTVSSVVSRWWLREDDAPLCLQSLQTKNQPTE